MLESRQRSKSRGREVLIGRVPEISAFTAWTCGEYRSGNPAVIGFHLDRWLCGPFFRKVCLFQTLIDRCTEKKKLSICRGRLIDVDFAGGSAIATNFNKVRRLPRLPATLRLPETEQRNLHKLIGCGQMHTGVPINEMAKRQA